MWAYTSSHTISLILHALVIVVVFVRVIMMRPEPGVALAWILIVTLLPGLGLVLYILFGERRIGRGRASRIGTVNLDMRSLWLNYEVSLFVYDKGFGADLHRLQSGYLEDCTQVDHAAWLARPAAVRFVENSYRLLSPLL